jgi:hypothetical protein
LLRSPPSKHIDPSYFKTVRRIGGSYFVVLAELDCYGYFRRQARFWARFKGTRRPHGSLDAAFALSELRRSPFRDFDTVTGFDGRAPYPFSGYGRASTFQTAYFIGEGYSRPRGLPRRDYNPDNVQTKFLSVQHSQSRHARRKNKLIG